MKKILYLILFLILTTKISYCQTFDKAQFNGNIQKYVATRLLYPISMQQGFIEGDVVVAFKINITGEMDSIKLIQTPHTQLSDPVLKVLEGTTKSWLPTKIDGEPVSYWYHFVVEYRLMNGANDKSLRLYEMAKKDFAKNKNENALEKMNRAIKLKPYKEIYYKLCSEINKTNGNDLDAQNDMDRCNELQISYFPSVKIMGRSITRTTAIGTTIRTIRY